MDVLDVATLKYHSLFNHTQSQNMVLQNQYLQFHVLSTMTASLDKIF